MSWPKRAEASARTARRERAQCAARRRGLALAANRGARGDGLGNVLEPVQPAYAEVDLTGRARSLPSGLADQHLAAARRRTQARCDVDSASVPVAVAVNRGTRVHADAKRRQVFLARDLLGDLQAE